MYLIMKLCLIVIAGRFVTVRVELVGPARENLGFSSIFIPPVKSIISSWRIAMIIPYGSMINKTIWDPAHIHTRTESLTLFSSCFNHHNHHVLITKSNLHPDSDKLIGIACIAGQLHSLSRSASIIVIFVNIIINIFISIFIVIVYM